MIRFATIKLSVAFPPGTCGVPMGAPRPAGRRRRLRDAGGEEA